MFVLGEKEEKGGQETKVAEHARATENSKQV
jgi:hypothetical protein